jgi:hypothetical protein
VKSRYQTREKVTALLQITSKGLPIHCHWLTYIHANILNDYNSYMGINILKVPPNRNILPLEGWVS